VSKRRRKPNLTSEPRTGIAILPSDWRNSDDGSPLALGCSTKERRRRWGALIRSSTFRSFNFTDTTAILAREKCLLVEIGAGAGEEGLETELRDADVVNVYQGGDGRLWAVASYPDQEPFFVALLGGSKGPRGAG
jgi:hypothetical protein